MITGELKSKVDRIWDTMWSGGVSRISRAGITHWCILRAEEIRCLRTMITGELKSKAGSIRGTRGFSSILKPALVIEQPMYFPLVRRIYELFEQRTLS